MQEPSYSALREYQEADRDWRGWQTSYAPEPYRFQAGPPMQMSHAKRTSLPSQPTIWFTLQRSSAGSSRASSCPLWVWTKIPSACFTLPNKARVCQAHAIHSSWSRACGGMLCQGWNPPKLSSETTNQMQCQLCEHRGSKGAATEGFMVTE